MKYKVGDKVRVRQWDAMEKEYGVWCGFIDIPESLFSEGMREYCGEIVTIKEIRDTDNDSYYIIEEDNGLWFWTDDMFESIYSCFSVGKECYDKMLEEFLVKPMLFQQKSNDDMLDAFTKVPKGEIKITAEETREMMKENKTMETKKVAHPKDEDHLKRVEKIQKRINYYKNMSGFWSIEEVVPRRVVKVTYCSEEYKMVCDPRDEFSMEKVLYLAIAKRMYGWQRTSEGIEKKAEELKYEKEYVKRVEQAMKMLVAMEDLEKENTEYEALLEKRRQKRWERKQRQMDRRAEKKKAQEEKEREEKIRIQTEAYLRAMKAAKEEGLVTE